MTQFLMTQFLPVSWARQSVRYSRYIQDEQEQELEALKVVRDPDLNRDIVSLGFVKDL